MTDHTTHFEDCGCQSAAYEAEIREYREAAIAGSAHWQARVKKLEAERDAALREADRIRHGHAIEGDFICPNGLEVCNLRAEVERLRGALKGFDPNDPQGFLVVVEKALAGKDGGEG